jgi:hypothetical protein
MPKRCDSKNSVQLRHSHRFDVLSHDAIFPKETIAARTRLKQASEMNLPSSQRHLSNLREIHVDW